MAKGPGKAVDKILVVGICGSLRPESHTRAALKVALEGAEEGGARTDLIDLREYNLPFCDGKDDRADRPDVRRLRDAVRPAQGVILSTPEYHGSLSGSLKNALDLMGFDEFEGKMIGLVGVSGGAIGAIGGLEALRQIGRALHAWVVPLQASIAQADQAFGPDGRPTDKRQEDRLKEVGRQVAQFACLHNVENAFDFMKAWEEAHPNPGG